MVELDISSGSLEMKLLRVYDSFVYLMCVCVGGVGEREREIRPEVNLGVFFSEARDLIF